MIATQYTTPPLSFFTKHVFGINEKLWIGSFKIFHNLWEVTYRGNVDNPIPTCRDRYIGVVIKFLGFLLNIIIVVVDRFIITNDLFKGYEEVRIGREGFRY